MRTSQIIEQAFILCAGKGTRLYPLTETIPKCLVPVQNGKVLDHILNHLEKYNVSNIICNIGDLKHKMEEYCKTCNKNIKLSHEETPLGTAGGLLNCKNELQDNFYVLYGDVLTNVNLKRLRDFYISSCADVALYVHQSQEPWTGGVVTTDENWRVLNIVEKPTESTSGSYINSGILLMNKKVIESIEKPCFDIAADMLPQLIKKQFKIYALPISNKEYVHDMGTYERLEKANTILNI